MEEQNQNQVPTEQKKPNKKNLFISLGILVLIIVLVIAGFFLFNNQKVSDLDPGEPGLAVDEELADLSPDPTRTPSAESKYTCADDKTIDAIFYNEGEFPSVDLELRDGEIVTAITLYQVESASGSKYANIDESMIFWNIGEEVYVEEEGIEAYTDCVSS